MKVYKEREKGSISLTVVYNPDVSKEYQDLVLRDLSNISDVFLVFPKSEIIKKRLRKFSNLYGATYYGIQEGSESVSDLIWEALKYGKELGGGYLGYFVIENNKILQRERLEDIKRLGDSLIESSIWQSRRLALPVLRSIYELPDKWWNKYLAGLKTDPRNEISRMYESHETDDQVLFLREITLTKLEDYFKKNKVYRDSFKESNFGTFISSAVERICPNTKINIRIQDAKT